MELKFETRKIYVVNYFDLDNFINHHYPNLKNRFEFAADEEMANDVDKLYSITGELDKYDEKHLKDGNERYMARTYLNDLCKKGIIPSGEYLIIVSW